MKKTSRRKLAGIVLTMRDIKELRRADAAARIEEHDRVQLEFIANVSHELRTPVTAIKGYAQTLKAGGMDDLKHRNRFIDTIVRHADRLASLIEDLLHISQLSERPQPRRRAIALSGFTKKLLSELAPNDELRRLSVRVNIPPSLKASADPSMLYAVLENLIGNAVQYNRPGGKVEIKAAASGGKAVISVKDTGVGIPRKDLPRVFERFYRTRAAKTRHHGAGLGLSIVRQIVAAHGGRVWVESRTGKGTAVRFTLPLAK